jgi:pyruvate dehydrogenase kinase 2/3/4
MHNASFLEITIMIGTGHRLDKSGLPLSTIASDAERVHIQVACFLHRELPIRLAHRIVELESIPIMRESIHVQKVISWYKQSFQELRSISAPVDVDKELVFYKVLEGIFHRHAPTLLTMAKGAHEMRVIMEHDMHEFSEFSEVQDSLDKFYLSRIGIRTLIGQYLSLKVSRFLVIPP